MKDTSGTKKILFVDDDEIFLSIVENMLKGEYEIITAKSGKEALDCLLKGPVPNLVLLDIVMPQMDGWETFNKIKGISLLKDVPVAFLTSVGNTNDVNHANEIGAADYIYKPCKREDLINRIEALTNK